MSQATRGIYGAGSVYYVPSKGGWLGASPRLWDGTRPTVFVKGKEGDLKAKREASTKLAELIKQSPLLSTTGTSKQTVKEYLTEWLEAQHGRINDGKSKNTYDNDRWAIEKWIVPAIGGRKLARIKAPEVEFVLQRMQKAGKSRSTIVRVKTVFSKALKEAVGRKEVEKNWAEYARMPDNIKATRPRKSLTPEQAETFLKALEGHWLEPMILLGLCTGMRAGELIAVCWDVLNVDVEPYYVTVSRSVKNEEGEPLYLGDLKGGAEAEGRTIGLPEDVVLALQAHRVLQGCRAKRARRWVESDLVFTTVGDCRHTGGTPLGLSNVNDELALILKRAKLPRLSLNELSRHSAASLLSSKGVPIEVLKDILGHKTTRMLTKYYRHQVKPMIDGHLAAAGAIIGAT